ncbi:MAG: RNA polymerase sigma-70 factor (ECF subfamily) [Marinoscillum sp.]
MQDPNLQLVERLRNKDKRAFELVFNEFYGLLKSYAMRFMDDSDDAEEVIQDVFVKFWDKCDSLAPDSSIKSYLYRSVHNTCLNFIKHQKVKDNYKDYVMHFMEEASDMEVQQEDDNVKLRIYEAIDNLTPRCSEIFKLSRFEGLKYQEIADHLGISIKTVEVHMGKALKTLRDKLQDLNK